VLWYLIVDAPPIPDYASTYQSGTYLIGGQAKPAAQALRFPFVVVRDGRRGSLAWGRAPSPGVVRIESSAGSTWSLVRTVQPAAGGVFQANLVARGGELLRARVGSDSSLGWRVP
jgi:hypothetical protein